MSRLWSCGFELNSLTAGVELTSVSSATIDAVTFRSGAYSLKVDNAEFASYKCAASSVNGTVRFIRVYVRFASFPGVTKAILNGPSGGLINIDSSNRLTIAGGTGTSVALSLDTWYRVEVRDELGATFNDDGAAILDLRVDGSSVSTLSGFPGGDGTTLILGSNSAGTYTAYFDDIAINDSSGSFQNSWPGAGSIVHLRPNADGDNHAFDGGANDYQDVDEVTPDDVTTYNSSQTSGDIDDYNIDDTPAAINSGDTITCVQVGVRMRDVTTLGTKSTFVLRVKASSGGTVEESSTITLGVTSWNTNAIAAPRNYALTLYDMPGASTTAWTKADLDTAQIGMRQTNNATGETDISTIWLLVDYTPAVGGGGGEDRPPVMLPGLFWGPK